jgi:thiol-disulfide isomerase/thioredoxin
MEEFVKEFPDSSDAPEAMLQLAIAEEFAGQHDRASQWYGRIVAESSDSPLATKAAGAKTRLDSVGKGIRLKGTALNGQAMDLAQFRGRVVLVHYWATWCEPCKQDLATLKTLWQQYAKQKFAIIGVGLDSDRQQLVQYVQSERIEWPQLYEPGGLDSRLANEMGVFTLPIMLLIDEKGQVLNRNIHLSELEAELKKRLP